jgi:glycosyltransferase involved in cell wall biosynthesis
VSRPRVLWVTEEVPDHDGGGGSIRQANLLVGLARHVDLGLVVAGRLRDDSVRSAVTEVVEVDVPDARPSRVPARLRAAVDLWVRRRGLSVAGSAPAVRALAGEVASRHRGYDVVVLNHEALLGLVPAMVGPTALLVAHLFDVQSLRSEQAAAVATSRRQARMWAADARLMRRFEERGLASVQVVVTCAQEDLSALRALSRRPLTGVVAPNGVDLVRFSPSPAPGTDRVLFFGSLHYSPNVDGVRWFARSVWPLVRAEVPDATLAVVGHRPEAAVLELGSLPGVDVVGDVPEAPPWYRDADVVVVPLRIGTGTRLKALEAMASARPVVGTALGLAGLGLEPGVHGPARFAEDAERFAGEVVGLLHDRQRAAELGASGRRHVEERYAWGRIADDLAAALAAAAATERAAR